MDWNLQTTITLSISVLALLVSISTFMFNALGTWRFRYFEGWRALQKLVLSDPTLMKLWASEENLKRRHKGWKIEKTPIRSQDSVFAEMYFDFLIEEKTLPLLVRIFHHRLVGDVRIYNPLMIRCWREILGPVYERSDNKGFRIVERAIAEYERRQLRRLELASLNPPKG